jgi:hypothetical protein
VSAVSWRVDEAERERFGVFVNVSLNEAAPTLFTGADDA